MKKVALVIGMAGLIQSGLGYSPPTNNTTRAVKEAEWAATNAALQAQITANSNLVATAVQDSGSGVDTIITGGSVSIFSGGNVITGVINQVVGGTNSLTVSTTGTSVYGPLTRNGVAVLNETESDARYAINSDESGQIGMIDADGVYIGESNGPSDNIIYAGPYGNGVQGDPLVVPDATADFHALNRQIGDGRYVPQDGSATVRLTGTNSVSAGSVKVYRLEGQSNCYGITGSVTTNNFSGAEFAGVPGAYMFAHAWLQYDVTPASPLYEYYGPVKPLFEYWQRHHGAEVSFASSLRKMWPDTEIYISKTAESGTGLADDWMPFDTGLYATGLLAYAYMTNYYPSAATETLDGVVWIQGENDVNATDAPNYYDNLTALIARYRSDHGNADLPFVVAGLGASYFDAAYGEPNRVTYGAVVDAAQRRVAEEDRYVEFVYAADLPLGDDDLHYTSEGQRILGQRIAAAMVKMEADNQMDRYLGVERIAAKELNAGKVNLTEVTVDGVDIRDLVASISDGYATDTNGLLLYCDMDGGVPSSVTETEGAYVYDEGAAAYFVSDGGGLGVDRYFQWTPPSASITNSDLTVSLWFKVLDNSKDAFLVQMGTGAINDRCYIRWDDSSRKLIMRLIGTTTADYRSAYSNNEVSTNEWHHVAVMIDRSREMMVGYIDGELEAQILDESADDYSASIGMDGAWSIGRYNGGSSALHLMDDPVVFDRVLNPAEIQRIIDAGRGFGPGTQQGRYQFYDTTPPTWRYSDGTAEYLEKLVGTTLTNVTLGSF